MRVDLRLAVPAMVCWLTTGILIGLPQHAGWVSGGLWLCAGVGVVSSAVARLRRITAGALAGPPTVTQRRTRPQALLSGTLYTCAAAAALASLSVAAIAESRQPGALVVASESRRPVQTEIRVESIPQSGGSGFPSEVNRERFSGKILVAQHGAERTKGAIPVVVFVPASSEPLHIGDVVSVNGTLRALSPGDSAAFLLFGRGQALQISQAPSWLGWANDLRDTFSDTARGLQGDGGALLPGLAIGDTRSVSAELDGSMKATSLSHLTAVSGANCAVITGLALLITGAMGLRRTTRVIVSLTLLAGFVVLVTPDASVLRAALMAVIVIFSQAAGRPARGIAVLAAVVIGLLVFDPWLARNYGFALSVLATGGLLAIAGPIADRLARVMPRALAATIAIPLAAQLACQPILILLSPTIPLYGVAANILAEPAAPLGTVLGLVGCVLLPWLPGIGLAFMQIAWVPASWIAAIAFALSRLPGSELPWLDGLAGFVSLSVCMVLALVVLLWRGRRQSTIRVVSLVILIVFAGGYAGVLIGTGIGERRSVPAEWTIAACDVGQGDAVVVRSGSAYALIDAGPDPVLLAECLDRLGIDHLDLLVLSHFDADHVGGLDAVIGRVEVALVGKTEGVRDERRLAALRAGGASVATVARGDRGTLGSMGWSVLWPRDDWGQMQTGNDGSVVIRFAAEASSSVFLGDLSEAAQVAMLAAGGIEPADIVKVAHHGSADQSARLYRELDAQLAIVSSGSDNTYGHPTDSLLRVLSETRSVALRTDERGTIVIAVDRTRSSRYTVWSSLGIANEADDSIEAPMSLAANRLVRNPEETCGSP